MVDLAVGDDAWLVDVEGTAFASADRAPSGELGDGSTGSGMPAVDDVRADVVMDLGDRLDPVDLEAVRLLGAVTPDMVGSEAAGAVPVAGRRPTAGC